LFVPQSPSRPKATGDEVIARIKEVLTQPHQDWQYQAITTPQGEPTGPETPRGTKYQFRCQQGNFAINVFIFDGETRADAEKILANSQRFLHVNVSKEVEGIGEKDMSWFKIGTRGSRSARAMCIVR
jgi:hypothetical protein